MTDAAAQLHVALAGARPTTVAVAPLDLTLGPAALPLAAPLAVTLAARIDGRARLRVEGKAGADGDADLAVDLVDLPLARLAAPAPPGPVSVGGGRLAARGRVVVAAGAPRFTGGVNVADLAVVERASGDPLVGWGRLDLAGIAASAERLTIARVGFDRLRSHVIVTRDQQLNLARVAGVEAAEGEVELPPDAADDVTPADADAGTIATSVAATAARETGALAVAARDGAGEGKVRVVAPITNTTGAAAQLLPIRIGAVSIRRSRIDFTDQSIEPHFAVTIDGFNGVITGLDSRPGRQARFDLRGFVGDRFAPASLTGRANPFAYDRDTDLTARFANIELPLLNPYSGRYAGYAIARGKLTTTLHWKIVNRGLDAQHRIVIDQLQWGAATGSKDKVPLPVRLASSLLKDRNGVITLDLPVKGTLDNPKFRIWPIVWKIVGNVIGKIALAPFKLLGSLFGGGGPRPEVVTFAPGSAAVAPESGAALAKIAKALAERPEVRLDIPAGPAGREDAAVMTRAALEAAVLAARGGKKAADYAGLAADTRRDRLRTLYKARFGAAPKIPGDLPGDKTAAQTAWLETALLPKFEPTAAALEALGTARAEAVKTALLADGALAAERVFVNTALAVAASDKGIEMTLQIRP
ncbi:hypothetical protein IP88_15650 [alpha proteobacterium AAP81b]|nr:hypothetical protein IP88_15650 [alpha proteobacterium AAP81b]